MAEAGGGPISVIARHMQLIRDDFISELFDKMKAEIRGLDYDARMADLWRASITENFVTAVHYLDRDTPQSLVEAPAAALAYARAAAQRDIPLSGLVRAHRLGHARFLEVAMQYVSLLEPADRVSTIIELVNRSARLVDLVADQLIVAYEHEHDRWLSRRSGLQQQWVSELLADTPVDVPRAERALGYRLDGVHIAAVVWVDSAVPIGDVVFARAHAGLRPVADSRGVRVGGNPGAFGVRSGRGRAAWVPGVVETGRTSEGVGPGRWRPARRPGHVL